MRFCGRFRLRWTSTTFWLWMLTCWVFVESQMARQELEEIRGLVDQSPVAFARLSLPLVANGCGAVFGLRPREIHGLGECLQRHTAVLPEVVRPGDGALELGAVVELDGEVTDVGFNPLAFLARR